MIYFTNSTEAFEYMFAEIMSNGIIRGNNKALFFQNFAVIRPTENVIKSKWRKFNLDYAKTEWQWYLSGDRSIEQVNQVKIWQMIADELGEVNSNYGWHWQQNDQIQRMIGELTTNPNTRRAILCHYDYNDLDRYSKDTPCNIYLNFQIVHNQLHLNVHCRSQDLVYGFCNDQYIWGKLIQYIHFKLKSTEKFPDLRIGYCFYSIDNIHIYERHYDMKNK